MKKALVTGITGQDGPFLANHLIDQEYKVWGLVRGQYDPKWHAVQSLCPGLQLVRGDLCDQGSIISAIQSCRPDVVFNLGALSFVGTSWVQPSMTSEVTGLGALRVLEAIRLIDPSIRFVQASSSEMFGGATGAIESPQTEMTPFAPRSPYAVAKVYAHQMTINYRDSYNIHASTAIMFNHESNRRGEEFVTRRITKSVAAINAGNQDHLVLGRLDPRRDWGHAPEYMAGMALIAAQDTPGDYVLATGRTASVAEFAALAFAQVGLHWEDYVVEDPDRYRPAEVEYLCGDASKAREVLGWVPQMSLENLVKDMVNHDLAVLK